MGLKDYAGKGLETIQDVKTPYLKIAQSLSDEVNKKKAAYVEGLEVGQFYRTDTNAVLGDKVNVIVLAYRKSYAFIDDDNQFKGSAVNVDPSWMRAVDGTLRTKEGYKAVLNYGYLVVTPDDLEHPMVMTIKRSDLPAALELNTKIKELKLDDGVTPCPIFGGIWELASHYRENDKGAWYSYVENKSKSGNVKFVGYIKDEIADMVASLSDAKMAEQQTLAGAQVVAQITDDAGQDF